MNENKMNLKKHSAIIQISNKISLQQRKTYNFLLYNAKELLKKDSNLQSFKTTISEIKRESGIKATDNRQLKKDIEVLQTTLIQFNLLEKDDEIWLSMQLLGQVELKKGDTNITYEFSSRIREALLKPNIYGLVDMTIIKGFESKYSIALYELLEDYKNVSIPKMTIEKFRQLMGVENKYKYFGDIRIKVIEVAIKEINEKTDFRISYDVDTVGRKVVAIKFNHTYKKSEKKAKKKRDIKGLINKTLNSATSPKQNNANIETNLFKFYGKSFSTDGFKFIIERIEKISDSEFDVYAKKEMFYQLYKFKFTSIEQLEEAVNTKNKE